MMSEQTVFITLEDGTQQVVAWARPVEFRDHIKLVVDHCPLCGQWHLHGWSEPQALDYGERYPHCHPQYLHRYLEQHPELASYIQQPYRIYDVGRQKSI